MPISRLCNWLALAPQQARHTAWGRDMKHIIRSAHLFASAIGATHVSPLLGPLSVANGVRKHFRPQHSTTAPANRPLRPSVLSLVTLIISKNIVCPHSYAFHTHTSPPSPATHTTDSGCAIHTPHGRSPSPCYGPTSRSTGATAVARVTLVLGCDGVSSRHSCTTSLRSTLCFLVGSSATCEILV